MMPPPQPIMVARPPEPPRRRRGIVVIAGVAMVFAAVMLTVPVAMLLEREFDGRAGEAVGAFDDADGDDDGDGGADRNFAVSRDEVDETVAELNAWWVEQDALLGFEFVPVPLDRVTDGAEGQTCDGQRIADDPDVEDNAYAGICDEGPVVAYDPAYVLSSRVVMQVTMAHEFAHHVQFQEGRLDPGRKGDAIGSELQADCWAGAWAADHITAADMDDARDDVRASGDGIGSRNEDRDAHGSPARRLASFEHGLAGGVTACTGDAFTDLLP